MTEPSISPKPVIAVVGPTATGKTALAVEIAQWLNTEVISADSQLIYRELNIGTAKPKVEEMRGIPHHMINVAAPDEAFSAASYRAMATQHMERLWDEGKIPVVAGGTGFYIRSILEAGFIPDVPPNEAFRAEMARLAEAEGPASLHRLLTEKDPQRAADLHPNDVVRVIRALEIIEATGQPVPRPKHAHHQPSTQFSETPMGSDSQTPMQTSAPTSRIDSNHLSEAANREGSALNIRWFGLTYQNRDILRALIDRRIEDMLAAGWLNEVETLVAQYGSQAHALQVAHGYPELVQVVSGERTLADAVAQIQTNIHQYARRQMTWFRRNPEIHWLERDITPWGELLNIVRRSITEETI